MYVCMHVAYQELGDELWSLDSMAVAFPLVISGDIKTMQSRWFYSRQKGQFPSQHFFSLPSIHLIPNLEHWNILKHPTKNWGSLPFQATGIKLYFELQKNPKTHPKKLKTTPKYSKFLGYFWDFFQSFPMFSAAQVDCRPSCSPPWPVAARRCWPRCPRQRRRWSWSSASTWASTCPGKMWKTGKWS